MKRFFCDCGSEIYFDNTSCNVCKKEIAFHPIQKNLLSGRIENSSFIVNDKGREVIYHICSYRNHYLNCNWLIEDEIENIKGSIQCMSCRLTEVIPDQDLHYNRAHWANLEASKRRLIYNLLQLSLPLNPNETLFKLHFHFLEDKRSNPSVDIDIVMTGHKAGLITINSAEADEQTLTSMKRLMGESYRTLLGHFRHEIGHFYWYQLIQNSPFLDEFRLLFGDERIDYNTSLENYYQKSTGHNYFETNQDMHWKENYISAYCQSHPFEDWAETWAHYLHMTDGLETAISYQICQTISDLEKSFDDRYLEWLKSTQVMNALNRSMGLSDSYPFAITENVKRKLAFIDKVVKG